MRALSGLWSPQSIVFRAGAAGIVHVVHPIERLRYVARAGSAPDRFLVAESVPAFSAFARDQRALLVALKGLIVRQPESPGLLALAAHMVQSLEPIEAGWSFADSLTDDRTLEIAETIAIAEAGGTDVIDSIATGRCSESNAVQVLCPAGTAAWVEHSRQGGRSVVIVTPLGSRLPALLWGRFLDHNGNPELGVNEPGQNELITLDTFDNLIGPNGIGETNSWQPDCPDVAEVARF